MWSDQKQPASFRGVAFEVVSSALTAGRRLARHEYPQRDVPYMEDMGRRAREYKVEAYIIGPDYMAGRDQLLEAIEQEGSGQLVHPYHGTKQVTVSECELTESTEFGGMAKFALTFVEAGAQEQPSVGRDTGAQLAQTQERAFDAIDSDFSDTFSVDGLPSWGLADITGSLTRFLNLNDFLSLVAPVSRFIASLGTLLAQPAPLAAQLTGLVRLLPNASGLLDRPDVPILASSAAVASNTTRGIVTRQQSVLTSMIKRTALVHQAGLVAMADMATSSDVEAARIDLLARFDAHDYAVGTVRPSAAVALQLKAVRSAALAHLSRQGVALPRTYTLQLLEPQPALALSYALYGTLRDDLVARNAVRHPGFIPAGVPLQVAAV